jgi:hypothetical protein
MSCPTGFEKTLNGNCRMKCPNDFKFMQDAPAEKCVHKLDNGIEVALNVIPPNATVPTFDTERTRFNGEIEVKREVYRTLQKKQGELEDYKTQYEIQESRIDKLRQQYADFQSTQDFTKSVQDITDSTKRPRGLETEIEKERKAISLLTEQNLLLVQVVLGLLVASLLAYIFLPLNAAHGLTFLLLCVGIAVGIFLKK